MSATIRPATAADRPSVTALVRDAKLVLEGLDALADGLLVAEAGHRLVGAVGIERYGPDGLLRSLVVDPSRRGTGLGDALTRAAMKHAAARGLETVWLLTETAEPFFAARGFTRVPRETAPPAIAASHEFATACPASAAFMRRAVA